MGYSAKAVANYFLAKYGKEGITPLKIQKLVYLAHGWNFAFSDEPLVDDEYAEAWQYGPVFPSLYHEFKHLGRKPIIWLATELKLESLFDDDSDVAVETPRISGSDKPICELLDKIWEVYGSATGLQLSEVTHRPDAPWDITRKRVGSKRNENIDNLVIKEYYRKIVKDRNS